MKKNLWSIAICAALFSLSSCSTLHRTASTMDVTTTLTSSNQADLVISQTKVRLESYVPTKEECRGGIENIKKAAVARLLRQNGDADVLIEPQFEITTRRKLITHRRVIKRITVSGYPATYKNFRTEK